MTYHPAIERLFMEVHCNIESFAEKAVQKIQMGKYPVSYPPNGGLTKRESKSIGDIDIEEDSQAMALKKLIADAIYSVIYKMMIDIDGLSSPDVIDGKWDGIKLFYGQENKAINEIGILKEVLGDSYWKWVKVRESKTKRMDNLKDDILV